MSADRAHPDDAAALERLIYDYASAIDQRDYALLRDCLDDELTFRVRAGRPEVRAGGTGEEPMRLTGDAFVERNRILFLGFGGTHHQITNLRLDVDGDTARERSVLVATHFLPHEPRIEYAFGAFYDNRFVRRTDGWRRTAIDITITWERGDAGMTERARAAGLQASGASASASPNT